MLISFAAQLHRTIAAGAFSTSLPFKELSPETPQTAKRRTERKAPMRRSPFSKKLACSADVPVDCFGDLILRHRSHNLFHHLPILEDQQRGYAPNVVTPRGVHRLVDVQLRHLQLARVIMRDLRYRGRQHMAR